MAQPSLQDIDVPFDPTGDATITGAGLLQYGTGLKPLAADKGLVVVTTDIAGVPQVPDAITNTKWKNYVWVRRAATSATLYIWNPAIFDGTYLSWQTSNIATVAPGSVTTASIQSGAVTNDKIYSVDWSKITSIPSTLLLQGSDAGGDLTGTYPNPTVAPNAVDSSKLKSDAVTDGNRAVTTDHIRDKAVTIAKLADAAVASFAPVGTILAYGGAVAPAGWLECDGTNVLVANYTALHTAIGNAWGTTSAGVNFNLPDLRGRFLRGWNHGAGNDPDFASRTTINTGGATADNVGSLQGDKLKDHKHNPLTGTHIVTDSSTGSTGGGGTLATTDLTTGLINGADGGGTETRPKNVYVMYIIKT